MTVTKAEQLNQPVNEPPGIVYGRMGIGHVTIDPLMRITSANSVFRRSNNLNEMPETPQDVPIVDVFSSPALKNQYEAHFKSINPDNPFAVQCIEEAPGHLMQVHSKGTFSPEGQLLGIESVIVDVTPTVDPLIEQLERTSRLSRDAVAAARGMYHDAIRPIERVAQFLGTMKNAVAKIEQRNADFSQEVRDLLAQAMEYLVRAEVNAARASNAGSAFLELTNLSKEEANMNPVRMKKVLDELRAEIGDLTEKKAAHIDIPAQMPNPQGDARWISRILSNLVSNAVKYGGEFPIVEIGSSPMDDGRIMYWVQDNGPGIAPEYQERLFKPFSRLHGKSIEGTGLGLALIKTMVEKMGGEVGLKSIPGEGSVFFFILPPAQDRM